MPNLEPSPRRAAIQALPALLLSAAVLAAATQAISVAAGQATAPLPAFVTLDIARDATHSPTAWLVVAVCAAGIALGIRQRSHWPTALGLLVGTAIVYFRAMNTWLEPVEGIIDVRTWALVMWLYMPQSLAAACFAAHVAIVVRASRATRGA